MIDSTRSSWIPNLINQIHVLTKESVIKSRLLFSEGDVYDQTRIDETARILRGMGIIGDIEIRCDTVALDTIDITIVTSDKWTLGMNTSYKRDGGITSYGVTIKDDNFLGNAQSVSIGYNYSSDRRNPHGVELILKEPHLFHDWWKLTVQYKNNEHLDIKTILVERPFYSDIATWSVGSYLDAGRNRVRIFKDGNVTQEYDIHQDNKLIWGAVSFGTSPKVSLGLAYIHTRTRSVMPPLRSSENIDLLNFSLGVMNRWYYTTSCVENFGRVEDIPLGFQGNLTLGKNFPHSETMSPQYFCRANWQHSFRLSSNWYVGYNIALSGFFKDSKPRDAILSFSNLQHLRMFERHILALRTSLVLGKNWSHVAQLTLGSQTGLRGYPAYALSGNRQLLINLEHRFFSDLEFWIFRFGSVIFFDTGVMWMEEERFEQQRFHSSAGFGLRIENTKQSGSGIIRIDFAFNFDEKRFAQIIFSSDHLFRAFQNIENTSPKELLPELH